MSSCIRQDEATVNYLVADEIIFPVVGNIFYTLFYHQLCGFHYSSRPTMGINVISMDLEELEI